MTDDLSTTKFDYAGIDAETKALCVERTLRLRERLRKTIEDIIETGRLISEVKFALKKDGVFEAWLNAEFGMTLKSAHNFMNVFSKSENFSGLGKNLDNFAPSALYLLTAPSTSKQALKVAVRRAARGERVTVNSARQIKAAFNLASSNNPQATPVSKPAHRYQAGDRVRYEERIYVVVNVTPDKQLNLRPTPVGMHETLMRIDPKRCEWLEAKQTFDPPAPSVEVRVSERDIRADIKRWIDDVSDDVAYGIYEQLEKEVYQSE